MKSQYSCAKQQTYLMNGLISLLTKWSKGRNEVLNGPHSVEKRSDVGAVCAPVGFPLQCVAPLHTWRIRVCIYSQFFLRCEGIWIDRVSLELDAWWLMVWRWFISHVRVAGSRGKALLSLSFEGLAAVFHFVRSLSQHSSLSLSRCYCRPAVPFQIWLWSCLVTSSTTSQMSCPHTATRVSFYGQRLKESHRRASNSSLCGVSIPFPCPCLILRLTGGLIAR